MNRVRISVLCAIVCSLAFAVSCTSTPLAGEQHEYPGYLPLTTKETTPGISLTPPIPLTEALIIDHLAVDQFFSIPDDARVDAIELRILVRHASVGENIRDGLDCLAGSYPSISECTSYTPGMYNPTHWDFQSRGNPGWREKVDDFVQATSVNYEQYDAFTMKFCFIDALDNNSPSWDYYREAMLDLERTYPDKIFIWWTIPLTTSGNAGADHFNQQVRQYVHEHHKVLFDIADLEAHDHDGNHLTNPAGDEILFEGYTDDGGHLNWLGRIRVAKAFWVLVARLNGWGE